MSAGDASYSYDDSGFLASFTGVEGATDLSWSAGGELLGSDGPGGAVSYEYDSAGVLVSRTDGAGTVGFVNDASQSLPHAVAGSDGSWWVYAGARPLAQATSDGGVHYLHADVRGDVRVVTDAAGSVTDTVSYSVDGEVVDRTGTTPVSVGWNGEYTDPDTDMVWLRARWYDPVSARFISADPWHGNPSVPLSLNRYLFANADPVNNVDPTGLLAEATVSGQATKMATQTALYSIRGMSVSRANFIIQAVLDATIAISATTFVAVQTFGADDPNDQHGIDGPGTVPDIDINERDSTDPEVQPQPATDGAGARNGGPVGCERALTSNGSDSLAALGGVYALVDATGNIVRTGRTKDLVARERAHALDPTLSRFQFKTVFQTDDYAEQRGLEQWLYDCFPDARHANGGYNRIRGISPTNLNRNFYMRKASEYLERMGVN